MNKSLDPIAATKGTEPGIRGGLLLLILWLGVIDPIYSVGLNMYVAAMNQAYDPVWGYISAYILVRAVMRVAAALILIVHRRPLAVWFAIAMLWSSGPAYVLVNWALFDNQVMPLALVRSLAIAIACSLYLLRSKRVQATYDFRVDRSKPTDISPPAPVL